MTDSSMQLLDEADQLIAERGPSVVNRADAVIATAKPLIEAADQMGVQSIAVRVGEQKAAFGDQRFRYYRGEDPPPPGSEYRSEDWEFLSEEQGRKRVEALAGVSFDQLLDQWEESIKGADDLRRQVLAKLEPVARQKDFDSEVAEVEALRKRTIRYTAIDYVRANAPSQMLVDLDDLDKPHGSTLHVANRAWAAAAKATAERAKAVVVELEDISVRVRNRAKVAVQPSPVTRADAFAPSERSALSDIAFRLGLLLVWMAIGVAGFIAALEAGWFGEDDSAPVVKAVAVAALTAATYALCRELLGWDFKRVAPIAGVFVAACGVAALLLGA